MRRGLWLKLTGFRTGGTPDLARSVSLFIVFPILDCEKTRGLRGIWVRRNPDGHYTLM